MGLLDNLTGSSIDDPKTLGLLSLAASLSSGQKFMPALAGGLLGRQQIMQDAQRQQTLQEMQRLQLAAVQRQAEQQKAQDAFRASLPSPQMQAAQTALANGGGPTVANAAAMTAVDPTAQMMHGAMRAGLIDPVQYVSSLRKDTTPVKLGAGETLLDPRTFKPLATNPKEDSTPSDWKLFELSGAAQRGLTFDQWDAARRRAAAPSVSVNTGPKAFDADLGKMGVSILEKGRETAQASAGVLESVGQIRQAAASGAYQGAGADLKLGAAKALGALGMPYDAKTVANSELFSAQANTFVLNSIKQLGANPSNADREFIEKTVPRLQTDPAALPALLEFIEGKARRQIDAYNTQARAAQKSSSFLPFSLEVQAPQTSGGWSIKPKGQ